MFLLTTIRLVCTELECCAEHPRCGATTSIDNQQLLLRLKSVIDEKLGSRVSACRGTFTVLGAPEQPMSVPAEFIMLWSKPPMERFRPQRQSRCSYGLERFSLR